MEKQTKIKIAAGALKLVADFLIPVGVTSVTKALTGTIRPNAPKIDTKLGRAAFKVGEAAIVGMVSAASVRYVEKEIDDYAELLQTGVDAADTVRQAFQDSRTDVDIIVDVKDTEDDSIELEISEDDELGPAEILVNSKSEAESVLEAYQGLIEVYGQLRHSEAFELFGVTGFFAYGWTDLTGFKIAKDAVSAKYVIHIPKAEKFEAVTDGKAESV